ncbi:MAG: hypothetical protein ACK2U0_10570 [Candidatus Promineifilaceae bacterium]|jgi:hypothetical protein
MNSSQLADILALINDILQAIIVIFGSAVVLYYSNRLRRNAVTRSFILLVLFVVLVYLSELLVSRIVVPDSAEIWLRIGWIGIAMVPAALFNLSSELLASTGKLPQLRRYLVPGAYVISGIFALLALFTGYVAGEAVRTTYGIRLSAGPLLPVFAFYFWLVSASAIYNVWRARHRCLTRTSRSRMTKTLVAFVAAPLAVFPYMMLVGNPDLEIPIWLWLLLIAGNLFVGTMFGVLTNELAYFGAESPDRVVRVRLYKFMARVPLAGTIVLLVYIAVSRNSPILGLPTEAALGFTLVATVMIVEWLIHAYKRPLERLFNLDSDPDVKRIQTLSERLVTTSELHQFLENVLAATVETLRTPTAFVAANTNEGPRLEAVIGPLAASDSFLEDADIRQITQGNGRNGSHEDLQVVDDFVLWQDYWIMPLFSRHTQDVLGIFGMRARADEPDFSEAEQDILERLSDQLTYALEDRILQQEVFASVEGLLPELVALQKRAKAADFGGVPALTAADQPGRNVTADPAFNRMVRDALTHYWGGPKLTESPLLGLQIVRAELPDHANNPINALRAVLNEAIEQQRPEGQRSMTTAEWILYNILELKFVQGKRVRDVARRLAMSESDLYRKQRVAIENVARTIVSMEEEARQTTIEIEQTPINEQQPVTSD